MKKFLKYAFILAAAVAVVPLAACSDDEEVDPYTLNYVYLYQPESTYASVEYMANGDFISGLSDPLELVPVRLTKPAPSDLTVEVAIDPTLVEEYNEANGTEYKFLEGATIDNPQIQILGGKYVSEDVIRISFGDHSGFIDQESNLILPVVIKSAPGTVTSKSSRVFLTFNSTYRANYVNASTLTTEFAANVELPGWQQTVATLDAQGLFQLSYSPFEDVKVTYAIDGSKVAEFNDANGSDYEFKSDATLAATESTVTPGSNTIDVKINTGDLSNLVKGKVYVIPVVLKTVDGASVEIGNSQVAYVLLRGVGKEITVDRYSFIGTLVEPDGLTATCNGSNVTNWVNANSWAYGNIYTGQVLDIDFGETVNNLRSFYVDHYYSSYSAKTIKLQTSADGENWDDWGSFTQSTYLGSYYVTMSYAANVRYMKIEFSDCYRSTYCEMDGMRFYAQK